MKIILFDVQTRETAINKTMAAGFGTSSRYAYSNSKNIFIKLLTKAKKRGVIIPLIDFAYLAAIFRSQNNEVEIIHGNFFLKADLYIIYASLVEYTAEISFARQIRKTYPEAKIGFIGLLPTVLPGLFLKYADFIIQGESESYFLVKGINDKLSGVIHAGVIENLDSLPYPDWSGFEMKKFIHYYFFGKESVYPVLASRGCPFSCGYYCPYPLMAGQEVRYRSIENIINELRYLREKYNAKAILFRDPNFTLDKERVMQLCNEIIENKLNIHWACEAHPSQLEKKLINAMYEAGARAITIGVESPNKEVLKGLHRYQGIEGKDLEEIVAYCEKKGISIMAGYMLGHPSDTQETINDTIDYAIKLNTTYAQFVISTPYPGTQYYEDLADYLITEDWTKYDTYTLVFAHPSLSNKKIEELKCRAYIKYYYRLRWILTKLVKRELNDFFNRSYWFSGKKYS